MAVVVQNLTSSGTGTKPGDMALGQFAVNNVDNRFFVGNGSDVYTLLEGTTSPSSAPGGGWREYQLGVKPTPGDVDFRSPSDDIGADNPVAITSISTMVTSTAASTNPTTGALTVAGGAGIGGAVNLGAYLGLAPIPDGAAKNGSVYQHTSGEIRVKKGDGTIVAIAASTGGSPSTPGSASAEPPSESPLLDSPLQVDIEAEFTARYGSPSSTGSELAVNAGRSSGLWQKLTDGWRYLSAPPALRVATWDALEGLPSELASAHTHFELLGYLTEGDIGGDRVFEKVSTGNDYVSIAATWHNTADNAPVGHRFCMESLSDAQSYIYEVKTQQAAGGLWDAAEEAKFTKIGPQLSDGGVNVVTASGVHLRQVGFQGLPYALAQWWGCMAIEDVDGFPLTTDEIKTGRFNRLLRAAEWTTRNNKVLQLTRGNYRMQRIRPEGSEERLDVLPGVRFSGVMKGVGHSRKGPVRTSLYFDFDTSPANHNVSFRDGDIMIANKGDSGALVSNMDIAGNTQLDIRDTVDYVDFSLLPSFEAFRSKVPGICLTGSINRGGLDSDGVVVSSAKYLRVEADYTGHRIVRDTFLNHGLLGLIVEFWGGDIMRDSCDFTTNAWADVAIGPQGLTTEYWQRCHTGFSAYGIYQFDGPAIKQRYYNPGQRIGLNFVTMVNTSFEGCWGQFMKLLDDTLVTGLSLSGCAGSHAEGWAGYRFGPDNNEATPPEIGAADPDWRAWDFEFGKVQGDVLIVNSRFYNNNATDNPYRKACKIAEIQGRHKLDLSSVTGVIEVGIPKEDFQRVETPEDFQYGNLSQYQSLSNYAPSVGGGNLLAVSEADLNAPESWSTPTNSTVVALSLTDPSLPVSLPEEFRDYYADAKVLKIISEAGKTPRIRMDMLSPWQTRLRPSHRQLWGSCLLMGDAGFVGFSIVAANSWRIGRTADRLSTEDQWRFIGLPGIDNEGDHEIQFVDIAGDKTDSVLYVLAPTLSFNRFAKYSPFMHPQIICRASDNLGRKMRLVQPTQTPGPANWEVYS